MLKIAVLQAVHGVLAEVFVPERAGKVPRARMDILYLQRYMQIIVTPVLAKKHRQVHIALADGVQLAKQPKTYTVQVAHLVPQKDGRGRQAGTIEEEILILIHQAPYQHQRRIILVRGAGEDGDVTAKEADALSRHGLPHHLQVHIRFLWDT